MTENIRKIRDAIYIHTAGREEKRREEEDRGFC